MTSIRTPRRRQLRNSVWGCSIGRLLLVLLSSFLLALGIAGCSQIPHANANIAFMGDSITELWWLPKTNLGVYGNTTSQMLARFDTEVIGHGYKAVVILGGTNDVRIPSQPIGPAAAEAASNLDQMVQTAQAAGLEVILCKIPPIQGLDGRVEVLNGLIATVAAQRQVKLVDYYATMAGHPEYFRDGEHPSDLGYFVMQGLLTEQIPLNY